MKKKNKLLIRSNELIWER